MINERLKKQIDFIVEIDKIKNIIRKSRLFDKSRLENDAEHSWTIAVMAMVLKEYSNFEVDMEKVLKMLLIHDVVEIDAGDAFLYAAERDDAHDKEVLAANRIFSILDYDQRQEYLNLWLEFEDRKTNESKFATVFDRLEPILQNYINEGSVWKIHGVTKSQVYSKVKHIADGSKEIWKLVEFIIQDSVEKGYLKNE